MVKPDEWLLVLRDGQLIGQAQSHDGKLEASCFLPEPKGSLKGSLFKGSLKGPIF